MSRKYFGTDGVRGRVGQAPMTPDFAMHLGWAAGKVLARSHKPTVLIGKDTRRSGYMFESALEAGFAAAGANVDLLGPIPTPGVAYLTRVLGADAGVVISASHNPHFDNGVKFFTAQGDKLSDELEMEIEAQLAKPLKCVEPEAVGHVMRIDDATERYFKFCVESYDGPELSGLHIVLDCAHGAAYKVAPRVLVHLGATVSTLGIHPNGFNINLGCGSTDLAALKETVIKRKADFGIALDGDGDRCLMVDRKGKVLDGDDLMYVIARDRQAQGKLKGPVVGTLMSNLGLQQALESHDVKFLRAKVGDRYVLEMLKAKGGVIGGETSGHVLCLDKATTGDGLISALQVVAAIKRSDRDLSSWAQELKKCPQVLVNVRITGDAKQMMNEPSVVDSVKQAEQKLGDSGRVLLRPSGTEPLIRVMVEAHDAVLCKAEADKIADVVRALCA